MTAIRSTSSSSSHKSTAVRSPPRNAHPRSRCSSDVFMAQPSGVRMLEWGREGGNKTGQDQLMQSNSVATADAWFTQVRRQLCGMTAQRRPVCCGKCGMGSLTALSSHRVLAARTTPTTSVSAATQYCPSRKNHTTAWLLGMSVLETRGI